MTTYLILHPNIKVPKCTVLSTKRLGLNLTEYVDAEFGSVFVLKVEPTPASLPIEVLVVLAIGQKAGARGSN